MKFVDNRRPTGLFSLLSVKLFDDAVSLKYFVYTEMMERMKV